MRCHKCFSLTPLKGGGGGSENYLREFSDRVREFNVWKNKCKNEVFFVVDAFMRLYIHTLKHM